MSWHRYSPEGTWRGVKDLKHFWLSFSTPVVVQSLNHVLLFATPWTAAHQASLSFTISPTLLKHMAIELVMPSNHLIFCRPRLLPPSIFPASGSFLTSQLFISGWMSLIQGTHRGITAHVITHWDRSGNLIAGLDVGDVSNYHHFGLVDLLGLLFKTFTHSLYMSRRNSINVNSKLTCITILHSSASPLGWSLQILHLQLRL